LETDLNNMTMRDLFAAFAMAGMLSSNNTVAMTQREKTVYTDQMYQWADAMIQSRSNDATGL
jgi:hypothetical protein